MTRSVDLNADIGEGLGPDDMGEDAALVGIVSSVSIACGGHAGDPAIMRRVVALSGARGIAIGAHPGFADRAGFGRRQIELPPDAVENLVAGQIADLQAVVHEAGLRLRHVKPHGALYNMAATRTDYASAIASAVAAAGSHLAVVAPAASALIAAARDHGLPTVSEAFPDRGYADDGRLLPRVHPAAMIRDPEQAARRALAMALGEEIETVSGQWLRVDAGTLCIHGDEPGAATTARAIRKTLEAHGFEIAPFPVSR